MKRFRFFIAAAVLATLAFTVSAQDECMTFLSYYQEYYKQGTKESKMAAIPSWRKAYSICAPNTRQNLYIHGADLYRMLISKNYKDTEYRNALIDTLVTLHQLRAQYYPNYAAKAYAALSKDVNNYLKDDPEKTDAILSKIIEIQGAQCDPVTFLAEMNAAVALYKSGKMSAEDVIAKYDNAVSCFEEIQKVDTTQNTKNIRTTVENAFINSKVASCENLQELFDPRFEEQKDDIDAVTKIVKLMGNADDCTDNDLFMKAVKQMHQLSPSANSAYYLFRLNANKDTQEALKYIEEAASAEDLDNDTKAQYNYELSAYSVKNGHYAKAVEAARKAMSIDDSYTGKANMIIGHAWMSLNCSGNEVERRAKFWVAADYFMKAKAADPSLADEAGKLIGECAVYYPQTAEAFMYDVQNGQSYTVSCGGMRAETTVRTR